MTKSTILVSVSGLVLVLAACSAASPATPTPAGGTVGPTTAATAGATPTAALVTPAVTPAPTNPPVAGVGTECASTPTFDATSTATPSLAADPTLDAFWPAQIDGQPVTEIQSASWLQTICVYGGQAQVDKLMQSTSSAALLANLTFGSAHASIGGTDVLMAAFRIPGSDANAFIQNASLFVSALTGATPEPFTTTQATMGGKQISVITDSAGKITYAYPKGDILVTLDNIDQTTAGTIFAALP